MTKMDDSQLYNIVIQLTDFLLDKGHTINKPLMLDAAEFVKMYAESWYEQGRMKGRATPSANTEEEKKK